MDCQTALLFITLHLAISFGWLVINIIDGFDDILFKIKILIVCNVGLYPLVFICYYIIELAVVITEFIC